MYFAHFFLLVHMRFLLIHYSAQFPTPIHHIVNVKYTHANLESGFLFINLNKDTSPMVFHMLGM